MNVRYTSSELKFVLKAHLTGGNCTHYRKGTVDHCIFGGKDVSPQLVIFVLMLKELDLQILLCPTSLRSILAIYRITSRNADIYINTYR